MPEEKKRVANPNDTHISVTVDMKEDLKFIAERDRRSMREVLKIMIEKEKVNG